jgi:hypothetical protein
MHQADFPWRPLGLLLVDKGLMTPAELELALTEQRRTGRLLGQILVGRGYVRSLELTQALAEQHGVELRMGELSAAEPTREPLEEERDYGLGDRTWRPLGKILLDKGFLSREELKGALAEQAEHPEKRLGEILVANELLSGAALAIALAEQHGLEVGSEQKLQDELETVVRTSAPGEPVYRVLEVIYEPTYRLGAVLSESTNFLEAADFACEFVERRSPQGLEIHKLDGDKRETVWTYSETRADAEAAARKNLVQTFGYDPMRWDTRGRFDTPTS